MVSGDTSTLEDFDFEAPTNGDSTQAISTGLDLLNQILEKQYYNNNNNNNIGVKIRFVIKQFKKCLKIRESQDKGKFRTHQNQHLRYCKKIREL